MSTSTSTDELPMLDLFDPTPQNRLNETNSGR